jgi:hypothetical protein
MGKSKKKPKEKRAKNNRSLTIASSFLFFDFTSTYRSKKLAHDLTYGQY